ncbi:hypothetical protein SAMN05428954_4905 [Streptomyces sp. 2112.3]|nr:hypothetical protein SAMN05428954_4905 [Streptomyces sp. 2112.3]
MSHPAHAPEAPPPQKPQNPQKHRCIWADQGKQRTVPPTAKIRGSAAKISPGSRPPLRPASAAAPAADFCGDSRDFRGGHPLTAIAAGQTACPPIFADSAVFAAAPLSPSTHAPGKERHA